ncbi:hypothetical protein [Cupriavidus gilardii]|uniref:hypothetical protein n=1 Tax=Cupriavidus gilardii TaxID=82541 RepID=UPI0021C14611|nr:hypothetical protein [Cupriavidus gilardii]MCT9123789.1 hypothetical protein [Cupriavidus gilardii]
MTLPPPYASAELEGLVAVLGEEPLAHLEDLRADDLVLVAAFIQTFNFVEFNLRRSVSSFVHAGLVQPKKRRMSSELGKTAMAAVSRMDPAVEDIANTVGRLNELEIRRSYQELAGPLGGEAHSGTRRALFDVM